MEEPWSGLWPAAADAVAHDVPANGPAGLSRITRHGRGERKAVVMTSITHRIATLFRIKADKALDRAEDPREVLDYSYEQQLQMLQRVRRGVADVSTSRKRVELQVNQLQQSTGKLQDQAQQALAAGREDLAREALTRRTAVVSQITDMREQQTSLQAQEEKLTLAAQRLQAKVDSFRTRKETIKAPTPRRRLRPGSPRRSPASARSWVTWAWPRSAPRTRRSRCRPAPVRWTS